MTIAATRGTESTIDKLVTGGMQLSGVLDTGQPASEADLSFGRQTLDRVLDSLQAEGVYARSVQFLELTLVAGEPYFTLDANVMMIRGDGAYIDASNVSTKAASGETPVVEIDREEWQRISAKDAQGRPTRYYQHRAESPLQVRLWPIPESAGTIRFQAQLLFADSTTGANTPDTRPFWYEFITWELAHQFACAKSLPVQTRSYLNKRAQELKKRARGFAHQQSASQMHLQHSTPWSRR